MSLGFGSVLALVCAVGVLVVPHSGPSRQARAVVVPTAMVGRPPTREDLVAALCGPAGTSRATIARCEHVLMPLYRACGLDVTHPKTARCRVLLRRIHRSRS